MTLNPKILALAALAALAAGVTMAPAAPAATHVFTAEKQLETISGTAESGVIELTSTGLSMECATVQLHAVVENGASEGTGEAALEGTAGVTDEGHCGSSLGTVDVHTNGCEVLITGNTDQNEHAEAWVECPGEAEIEATITEFGIVLSLPSQTPTSGGITYTNNGEHVDADATVEGITYTCHPAFLCGLAGIGTEGQDADLTGSITMSGANGPISFSGR